MPVSRRTAHVCGLARARLLTGAVRFRTLIAGVAILACLLAAMLPALFGAVGHVTGHQAPHAGAIVVAGHEVHVVDDTSSVPDECDSRDGAAHWRHGGPVAAVAAKTSGGTTSLAVPADAPMRTWQAPPAAPGLVSRSLTPVPYALCVMRT